MKKKRKNNLSKGIVAYVSSRKEDRDGNNLGLAKHKKELYAILTMGKGDNIKNTMIKEFQTMGNRKDYRKLVILDRSNNILEILS